MGDKLLLNFGAKFQKFFFFSHVKLQNCNGNVWSEISRYNKQVKNPGLKALFVTYDVKR